MTVFLASLFAAIFLTFAFKYVLLGCSVLVFCLFQSLHICFILPLSLSVLCGKHPSRLLTHSALWVHGRIKHSEKHMFNDRVVLERLIHVGVYQRVFFVSLYQQRETVAPQSTMARRLLVSFSIVRRQTDCFRDDFHPKPQQAFFRQGGDRVGMAAYQP